MTSQLPSVHCVTQTFLNITEKSMIDALLILLLFSFYLFEFSVMKRWSYIATTEYTKLACHQ